MAELFNMPEAAASQPQTPPQQPALTDWTGVKTYRLTEQFESIFDLAVKLSRVHDADALMLLLEGPTDWKHLKELAGDEKLLIAADVAAQIEGAPELGLATVLLKMPDAPVYEKLT